MSARFATQLFSAVVLSAMAWVTPAGAQGRYDPNYDHWRRDRYETEHDQFDDRTYDRMRELAHVLDEQAQHAADQAIDAAHHGGRGERRFLSAITHFARQAADFHERLDRYRESPWDVPDEVDHLVRDARRVDRQIHDAHVFEHTWDDWDNVVDIVARMQRVVGDEDDRYSSLYRH